MHKLPLVVCVTLLFTHHLDAVKLVLSKGFIDRFIDGYAYGIDGKMFGLMLKIRRELKHIIDGDKEKKGFYIFNQNSYTLEELVLLEKKYHADNNTKMLDKLSGCLTTVKQDLDKHLTKYAELAKGVKQYLLVFINESCEKHGRKSSILQHWAKVKEGHESEQLHRDLVDFQTAHQFCLDLIHFLEDMCDSCTEAQKQFEALIKTAQK